MKTPVNIKNIIFDFGGVILNIDHQKLEDAFRDLGIKNFEEVFSKAAQSDIFRKFEIGAINPDEFRNGIRKLSNLQASDSIIDHTWNQILGDYPIHRIELLKELSKNYRLFLLSNTNIIHYKSYIGQFEEKFGYSFLSLFDETYWSFKISKRKPDPEPYLHVLEDASLLTEETLFIDDTIQNIHSSNDLGIKSYFIKPGEDVAELFNDGIIRNDVLTSLE